MYARNMLGVLFRLRGKIKSAWVRLCGGKSLYITGIVLLFSTFQTLWFGLPQYTMKCLLSGNLDLWQGKEVTRFK